VSLRVLTGCSNQSEYVEVYSYIYLMWRILRDALKADLRRDKLQTAPSEVICFKKFNIDGVKHTVTSDFV